ncbi:MAG TPA: hypothetical protein VG842_08240, partial [Sediminibacterium sp.]|nr:hypothetical protein [Sediminibacterium sp.]
MHSSRFVLSRMVLPGCLAMVILAACSPKPYRTTNKVYRQTAKAYAERILEQPSDPVNDTIKVPDGFIGTTNFGIRKPNFVIIHHTAQNSCPETL